MKRPITDGAVFARNHRKYLEEAVDAATVDPRGLVTFRSRQEWKTAGKLLEENGEIPIYFAVIDEGPQIQFTASLRQVLLHPQSSDEQAQHLLLRATESTRKEGLWEKEVATLYAVSGCDRLADAFPISRLSKLSNGEPVAETYRYSYSLVRCTDDTPVREQLATDVSEPPLRVQTRVNRIIRDTALVQRLKKLHDHHCQRCSVRLDLQNGAGYSEGHHLRPLGRPHDGPDIEPNILILCPNCHALMDFAAVRLEVAALRLHAGHQIGPAFVAYHNELCLTHGAA